MHIKESSAFVSTQTYIIPAQKTASNVGGRPYKRIRDQDLLIAMNFVFWLCTYLCRTTTLEELNVISRSFDERNISHRPTEGREFHNRYDELRSF